VSIDLAGPGDGAWTRGPVGLAELTGQIDLPQYALVGPPRQNVVGALRGVDHAVVVLVDAVLDPGGDHDHAARAPVGDRDVAVEVDAGPRGIGGQRGIVGVVAGQLDAVDGVDLRDRALRGIGDPEDRKVVLLRIL